MKNATAEFAAAISKSHRLATLVEVLSDGEPISEVTEAIRGTVSLDATAATRGRLDIALVDDGTLGLVPTNAQADLAPYGNELRVSRGIQYPDDTIELVRLGVFRIDDVNVTDQATGMELVIAGLDRSARIIDARIEEPEQVDAGSNYTDAIRVVLQAAWPSIPMNFTETTRTTPQLILEEGGDRWAFVLEMAKSIGMALYFDGDGVCVLEPATSGQEPVATLAEGDDGVLIQDARRWTRQGAFNRVIATGENTGETAPARGVATDDDPSSPTYYYGPFGRVPRFYASPFITTDDQAEDAAQALLSRELGTTQQVEFGTLVDPRLEPDDVVRITRARSGLDEVNVIDAVTIPLEATGVMTGRTRATTVIS